MAIALIINDNMVITQAIRAYLRPLGFDSFYQEWTEDRAVAAARRSRPDLVVIGDELEEGSSLNAARRISGELSVPVLMVTGEPWRARKRLADKASFEGPFLLNEIETAVELASKAPMPCAGKGWVNRELVS